MRTTYVSKAVFKFVCYLLANPVRLTMRGTAAASDVQRRRRTCRQYAVLIDDGRPGDVTSLCGGSQRVTDAYLSIGSTLQVRITAGLASNDFQRFVIAYTGPSYIHSWRLMGSIHCPGWVV